MLHVRTTPPSKSCAPRSSPSFENSAVTSHRCTEEDLRRSSRVDLMNVGRMRLVPRRRDELLEGALRKLSHFGGHAFESARCTRSRLRHRIRGSFSVRSHDLAHRRRFASKSKEEQASKQLGDSADQFAEAMATNITICLEPDAVHSHAHINDNANVRVVVRNVDDHVRIHRHTWQ